MKNFIFSPMFILKSLWRLRRQRYQNGLIILVFVLLIFSLVSKFHGNWKILECGIYDKQDFSYLFWEHLAKTIGIVCLRWNFASRPIWTCWIWWWSPLSLFWTRYTLFGEIWSKKNETVCFRRKLVPWLV